MYISHSRDHFIISFDLEGSTITITDNKQVQIKIKQSEYIPSHVVYDSAGDVSFTSFFTH